MQTQHPHRFHCSCARAPSKGGAFAMKAGLALALGLWTLDGLAAQASNTFEVRVNLLVNGTGPNPVPPVPPIPTPPPVPPNPIPTPPLPVPPGPVGGGGNGNTGNNIGNGLCLNTTSADAFGARATVVCSTGALVDLSPVRSDNRHIPIHGGAMRYVTQVSWNGESLDSIDDSPGIGTVTSWRRVNLANRQYLELTVGW